MNRTKQIDARSTDPRHRRFDMVSCGAGTLKERIKQYNSKAVETQQKLEKNPFSEDWTRPDHRPTDDRYGRPEKGSLTEIRGIAAGNHVGREILDLCDVIDSCGIERYPDGLKIISFGNLFNLYTRISDKVVGMLIRARKYGFVDFEGEMLYQRQDERKIITLLKPMVEIRKQVKESGDPSRCLALPKSENDVTNSDSSS